MPNKASVWDLVSDLSDDSLELYQGLSRRFSPRQTQRGGAGIRLSPQAARGYYIAALIVRGRIAEAVTIAASGTEKERSPETYFNWGADDALKKTGHQKERYEFLRELLRRRPETPSGVIWRP